MCVISKVLCDPLLEALAVEMDCFYMHVCLLCCCAGAVPDVYIVPTSVAYDRVRSHSLHIAVLCS